ncbi:hypothetical protein [Lactiplantibacillus plantarum]|uniref:hypothetical protein n=1 Tax=Lactiplantibacillus plantarum TaxID=1590 RepID=UPI0007BC20E3|nr:hypothetical protein [Lactiplantibacillus plantarum]KZU79941.1 hypothetical protein Nizo3400_2502 [Lactiplantibacillus plantarum]
MIKERRCWFARGAFFACHCTNSSQQYVHASSQQKTPVTQPSVDDYIAGVLVMLEMPI